ncbi:purine and uridine phosphorylase [Wallemia mellicola]|nr:purine and uridine phosphorylase [Wallemia mellicola]
MKDKLEDANFPRTADKRVYHLGLRKGEVANRLLVVGDSGRARMLAENFDSAPFQLHSDRGFECYTGLYNGKPISILAIGMGFSAMDFLVREARACVDGEMVIVSCGSLDPNIGVGSLVTPLSACAVTSNYDYFTDDDYSDQEPYLISRPVNADPELHSALFENVKNAHGVSDSDAACVGHTVNASADSFYSSQGRTDPSFYDANDTLLESIVDKVPNVSTLEMETHQLYFLAHLANKRHLLHDSTTLDAAPASQSKIRAAAVQMVFAARASRAFISPAQVKQLQNWVGRACLDTLSAFFIPPSEVQQDGIWN